MLKDQACSPQYDVMGIMIFCFCFFKKSVGVIRIRAGGSRLSMSRHTFHAVHRAAARASSSPLCEAMQGIITPVRPSRLINFSTDDWLTDWLVELRQKRDGRKCANEWQSDACSYCRYCCYSPLWPPVQYSYLSGFQTSVQVKATYS